MTRQVHDGIRWELKPEFASLLQDLLRTQGEAVKESPVKRVTRHQLGDSTFYIKRYLHHAVPLRPLKFFFKRSQAHREWVLAGQLEARGVPVVRHLGLGERITWRGVQESILITEGFDGVPLDEAPGVSPAEVLAFVTRMHERGVLQRDLHPANLLWRAEPPELRLVDLHGTRVQPQLKDADRDENLALLRVFLPVPVGDGIIRRSVQLRKELLRERARRCWRHNRDFTRQRHGSRRWQVRIDLLTEAARKVLQDPDGFLKTRAKILKPGLTATVGKADGLVLKRFNFRKLENLVKDLFRHSRAHRAFQAAYHLELSGIPTARAVASADWRQCGFLRRSYLLMEEISGARDLGAYLRKGGEVRAALVRQAAELIARLHEEGFSHPDLKETNLVLDSAGRLFVIDLDGMQHMGNVPRARAAEELARLGRGMAGHAAVRAGHRQAFLRAYCRARGLRRVPRSDS